MSRRVFAIITNQDQLHEVINRLDRNGFRRNDLSVILPEQRSFPPLAQEGVEQPTPEKEADFISNMAALGEVAVPGFGSLLMTAPLLGSLNAVRRTTNLVESLIADGIGERQAKQYDARLVAGDILIAVQADDAAWIHKATRVLRDSGARDPSLSAEHPLPPRTEADE